MAWIKNTSTAPKRYLSLKQETRRMKSDAAARWLARHESRGATAADKQRRDQRR